MTEEHKYDNCSELLQQILPHKHPQNIQLGLDARFGALKDPRRAIRTLSEFLSFISDHEITIESCEELSLFFHNYQEVVLIESTNRIDTIYSDLNALRYTIESLQLSETFPKGHIAKVLKKPDSYIFRDPQNDANKVLGGLELPCEDSQDDDVPLALRMNKPADEFLESLISNIRKHRNTLLHIARAYLKDANNKLFYADSVVNVIPPSLFDDPNNFTPFANKKGQRYSLFNQKRLGELGKMNLIAYLHHKYNGLITRKFSGGQNHIYQYNGSAELREYFGLSKLSAVAAQIIIIIESGINVSSLRNIKVGADGKLKDTFRITDDGFNIIYDKLRADSPRNKQMIFIDDSPINIDFAFKYLLRATKRHRELAEPEHRDYLFIHDTMKWENIVCRMSDNPFKTGLNSLLVKAKQKLASNPAWCIHVTSEDIDNLYTKQLRAPNAKQIRVSEGILRWYDSGGNIIAAANYLGNTESVALKNYIPSQLQGVLYSHQIIKFQHLLLAAATDEKSYQKEVLYLNKDGGKRDYYQEYIAQLDSFSPNWRQLTKSDEGDSKSNKEQALAMIMNEEIITSLVKAFNKENRTLQSGLVPSSETSLLSEVFKNLVSFVNVYGKGNQRRMVQEVILKERERSQ